MYRRIVSILIITLLFVLSGCGKKSSSFDTANINNPSKYSSMGAPAAVPNKDEAGTVSDQNTIPQNKKIIQNFQVYITVEDIRAAAKEIENKIKELGGYIEAEDVTEYGSNSVIRIPAQKSDSFIEYVEKSYEVTNKSKSIEDITSVYVDNDARLKNLRAEEAQVLEIMKKANTVEEILKVQSELYKIREEVEILEARKKNWDRLVDYSTIRLNISKKQLIADKKLKLLTSEELFGSSWQGFKNTFTAIVLSLQTMFIFLFSNLIPLVIIGGVGYTGYRFFIKKKKKL